MCDCEVACVNCGNDIGPHHLCSDCLESLGDQALLEAAEAWQLGAWADAPRRHDRVQERIANAQFVGDWLRGRTVAASRTAMQWSAVQQHTSTDVDPHA